MKKGIFCVLVCMLMILSTIVPVSATTVSEKTSHPLTTGNLLYVGGLGPNNYTRIQDAINDSFDGDTIFVYDDSSPYYENIMIRKSIVLIGEDKNTTIIDGRYGKDVTYIKCNNVTISGFTIQHDGETSDWAGIWITGNDCIIEGNIIQKNDIGIFLANGLPNINPRGHRILNNIIQNNQNIGIISVIGGSNFTISGNIIAKNGGSGIALGGTINSKNNIVRNIVTDNNHYGIWVLGNLNYITENTVQNHKTPRLILRFAAGITIQGKDNIITRNNLINNSRQQAYQKVDGINRTEIFNIIKENNFWDGNYWGEPLTEPKRIVGRILINAFLNLGFLWLPWTAYDKHPAQEPYDIPEMR